MISLALLLATQTVVVPPDNLVLFALMGQSNMSGRGSLNQTPAYLLAEQEDIYTFGNDYQWHQAKEPVDIATNQVDAISVDGTAGLGPSLAFAIAYRDSHPGTRVGLIPCAKGAQGIYSWDRNLLTSRLYGSCLKRINQAMQYGTLGGVLWYQGETDALDPATNANVYPMDYANRFYKVISMLRLDLNMPTLPVVFAQLATCTDTTHPYWDMVKSQQASLHMGKVGMVYTEDLSLADSVHLSVSSYITLGGRFADAMTKIENQPICCY